MLILALLAAQAATVCPVKPVIPPELRGWSTMVPIRAGSAPVALRIGQAVSAKLLPSATITYPVAPGKPGAAGTSGGVFAFQVATAGRYRVALGAGAWIDVVRDGKAVESQAHGHGPDCSTVRKMVDFDLTPGLYMLQVAGNAKPTLSLMIARLR